MARLSTSTINARSMLVVLCAVLFVTSLLPARWSAWESWLGELTELAVAPLQRPLAAGARWLHGGSGPKFSDPAVQSLKEELDRTRLLAKQLMLDKEELQRQIVGLQRGLALNSDLSVKQLTAPVIGFGGDSASKVIKVQAGEHNGVIGNSVAVVDGVNLVGRVSRVESRISFVTLITDRSFTSAGIRGRIYVNEIDESDGANTPLSTTPAVPDPRDPSLLWKLESIVGGRLSGQVEMPRARPGESPPTVKRGMIVRLDDDSWPRNARMLVIGRVEEVQESGTGRQIAIVRPMFDAKGLGEITLRISAEPDAAVVPGTGGGKP